MTGAVAQIPDRIREFVALDVHECVIYVERRKVFDPHVTTWVARCQHQDGRFRVEPADMDQLAALRELETATVRPGEEDLRNRGAALELIRRAADLRVSDIHLLLPATHCEIQGRLKGELRVLDRLSYAEGEALSRALYQSIATARDASYNPREFQNAQISGRELAETGLTSIRIVRGPCFPVEEGGTFMILRLQYGSTQAARYAGAPVGKRPLSLEKPRLPAGELRLSEMGFTSLQEEMLRMMAEAPNGVVILTGPTGSGKTSTIYEQMAHLGRELPGKRIITIEDPVEYPMSWAVQLEVSNASSEAETGQAFMHRVRVALRMDPDIIMCGEIRGVDVAIATINAALTGHLVYTTLHVTDPFLAIDRLEIMDRERLHRQVFCDHTIIRGLVAQRLVPRLCNVCAQPYVEGQSKLPPYVTTAMRSYGDVSAVRLRGNGCPACGGDGIAGRIAVAEVVTTTPDLMHDFVHAGTGEARRRHRARKDADKSLFENAVARVLAGEVDPRDVGQYVDLWRPHGSITQ
jgi:type II secretory ATPase GspE/PulE/Tfp pilus assembly ATPase PilB-like protein